MTPAAAAILEGMPDPSLLHRADRDGTTWILAGSVVLACYPSGDAGLRNVAVAVCRQLGFGGRAVAAVMGLTENYVATLHNRALRQGTAGLVRAPGRPRKLAGGAWEKAARWRAGGASDSEIARRLGVAQSTVFRRLGPAAVQEQLPDGGPAGEPEPQASGPEAGPAAPEPPASEPAAPGPEPSSRPAADPGSAAGAGPGAGPARVADGVLPSRYAGATLAHAYYHRIGAEAILAAALPPGLARPRYDDLALLTATSLAFALGASSAEAAKHLIPDQAGLLAGIGRLPDPRTLRPRLAAIADRCDPLALQRQLAAAMLAADAPGLHVYYVDDHFVPYEGAKPVPKGWNTKRRHAQPGRADTLVSDYQGRAVAFATGDPSGLAATLPPALAQLRQVPGTDAKILFGFDRGGSYPVAFRAIRDQHAGWVTWRRGPLAPVTAAPRRYWAARGDGKPAEVLHLADETITIKDYGQGRQITLLEDGAPVLQVLTSDTTAPAAALLAWLRCRWRIENLFKYLEDNYGIHWPAAPGRGGAGRRRARARHPAHQPGAFRRRQEQGHPARREEDHQGRGCRRECQGRAQAHPRQAARQPGRPRRAESHPAHPAAVPADGPAAARRRRRALARRPAQRLPARQQRVPRHHPPPAPPRRHDHLHPPRDHRDPQHPGCTPDRPRPRPAPRRDQRRAAP